MADHMVALATGLSAVLLFLVLIGLTAYLLWKKRQDQRQDRLISTNPVIPACTPVLQTSQRSTYGLGELSFFLPPSFKSSSHASAPEGQEEQEQWEQLPHLHSQRGSLTIGSWFPLGSLRPDLYQLPEEPSEWAQPSGSTVRLCFAVQYQQEQEQLVVSLLQAANMPAHYQSNATLVNLQLLPSEDRHHRQAKARCKGCQPQFNDTFVFQVSNNVDQFTLRMSLYTVDRLKKHHLVGHVLFPLKHSELREAVGKVLWRDLETESDLPLSKHGNIQVSLNYSQSLQRLTVVVLRARGLQCPSNADVSVQVSLQIHTQVVKTKWTALTRGTNPTFNEKLTFRLLPVQLDAACLSLEVQHVAREEPAEVPSIRTKTPISLGLVVIGPFMYARGRELEHWNEMISKSQELVKQWHGLGAANNTSRPM
ncbi:synaptotagmin-15 [Tachysurus fulvidraco]|uniref:synaptotagmin-15 n=1 Tax=Tachysurus fulvidraco TaxID=1234273 RepID=UPI000F50AE7A|nr:synaptotagmin-15 [Tachysurus fulvidraco]